MRLALATKNGNRFAKTHRISFPDFYRLFTLPPLFTDTLSSMDKRAILALLATFRKRDTEEAQKLRAKKH